MLGVLGVSLRFDSLDCRFRPFRFLLVLYHLTLSALTVLGVGKLQFVELKVLFCVIVPDAVDADALLCVVLLALLVFGESSFAWRCQGLLENVTGWGGASGESNRLGFWSNNVTNSHPSPGPFDYRVLRSCLVPQYSYPPY